MQDEVPPLLPPKGNSTPSRGTPVSMSSQGSTPTNELNSIEETPTRTNKPTPPPVPSRPRSRDPHVATPSPTPSTPASGSPTPKTPGSPVSRPPPTVPPPPVPRQISIDNSPIHNSSKAPNGSAPPPIPSRPKSQHRDSSDMSGTDM